MRPAILHFRDPRFRIMRVHPVPIGQRFLPLPVKALPLLRCGLLRTFGLHQLRHIVVWVIDTANNTVVATVPVGSFPNGVAITPNGAFVYVSNRNDTTVSVISTATNMVVA
jgi:hypothetical protein